MALGFGLFAAQQLHERRTSAPTIAADQLLLPNIVRAIGQALVLTPLSALAIGRHRAGERRLASALLNMMRNLGGAIGIALLQTFLTKREQFHSNVLGQSVSVFDEATRTRLDQLTHYFLTHGVSDPAVAWHKAVVAIGNRVHQQAYTMAFGDTFYLLGAALVVALVAALLLKKPAQACRRAARIDRRRGS